MQYAPICLFTYNRLWHTQCTIASLQCNRLAKESHLIIYSDGPKNDNHVASVAELRKYLRKVSGFQSVQLIERPNNFGLAKSIISGVTELTNKFGRVIVVEDDLVVSPHFLDYMNQGLNLYQNDENVASIHGYTFPIKEPLPSTYFLRGADCWGWATWKRAWGKFESNGTLLLQKLQQQKLLKLFDFQNTQPNIQMLKDQIVGKNNSWAIRWLASAFLNNMLTLYPGKSLVRNIGLDNSGENCVNTNMYDVQVNEAPFQLERIPLLHNENVFDVYVRFFKSLQEPFHRKLLRRVKKLMTSL
ncbi:MAG: glycosyltransferase [Proteobacteria bacterium]|nr:glycosyltransferase [Pseudomonadota bacterium]